MSVNFDSFAASASYAVKSLPLTIYVLAVSVLIGIAAGSVIALVRFYKIPVISQILAVAVAIYQGIPFIVLLMIYNLIYIMTMPDILAMLHISKSIADINTANLGIFALSLMAVCMFSETIRGALASVPKGQMEGGLCIGLTKIQVIRRIILPQVVPVCIAPMTNNIVGMIKATAILSIIGISEVTFAASQPAAVNYAYFESYLAAAVVYWIFTICVECVATLLEKYTGKFRRTI